MSNERTIKTTDESMRFLIKLKHNIKTVRINNAVDVLKVKEVTIPEAFNAIVSYFKTHNKEYQEMLIEDVKRITK